MITTLLGYLMLAGFSLIEGQLRRWQEAKSFVTSQFDKCSTWFLGLAYLFTSIMASCRAGIKIGQAFHAAAEIAG